MKLYYLKNVATLEVRPKACKGCKMCLAVCPHNVLEVVDGKVQVKDRDACMECGACMRNCPAEALRVKPGVGCAAAVINSMIKGGEPDCSCGGDDSCC